MIDTEVQCFVADKGHSALEQTDVHLVRADVAIEQAEHGEIR